MEKNQNSIIPFAHRYMKDSVFEFNNPLGISEDRSKWAEGLFFDQEAGALFFAGCGYQTMKYTTELMNAAKGMQKIGLGLDATLGIAKFFKKSHIDVSGITAKVLCYGKDDPYSEILINGVQVLQKLGVKINYLGKGEPCCGSPLYYAGFVHDYKKNARSIYDTLQSCNARKIIGMIPACTYSLKRSLSDFDGGHDYEVVHFTQVVGERLAAGDVKMKLPQKVRLTYHDPCQMSRYLKIIEEPRRILHNIEGVEFVEAKAGHTGKWSTCCGGGGGLEVISPELSEKLAADRVGQLLDTGASAIVTSCPFCIMQLKKGLKKLGAEAQILDIAQITASALCAG